MKINKINKILRSDLSPLIIKLKECISLEESINLEIEMIKFYGKLCDDNGILTNLTNGGEFCKGNPKFGSFNSFYGKHHTIETKAKISKIHKGKKIT